MLMYRPDMACPICARVIGTVPARAVAPTSTVMGPPLRVLVRDVRRNGDRRARRSPRGLLDDLGDGAGAAEHDRVGGIHLRRTGVGPGGHEALHIGVDGVVLAGDQSPRGNGAKALFDAGVGDGPGVGGPLGDGEVRGGGLVEVTGEGAAEPRRVDDDLRAAGNLGGDQRQRRGRPGGELTDGLAPDGDECGDVDEGSDVGHGGRGVGDDGAAVRMADEHLGTVDGGQVAPDVGGVTGQTLQRIGDGPDGVAVVSQPLDDRGPARGVRPRSVDEDDGRLRAVVRLLSRRHGRKGRREQGEYGGAGDRGAVEQAKTHDRSNLSGRGRLAPPRIASGGQRPKASSSPSHTSLNVGKTGTACQSRSSGTSPTTAIVAACSSSATSGLASVKPTITFRSSSTTMRACPRYPSACRADPATAPRSWSRTRIRSPAAAAAAAVSPTDAISGSVKTACGTARSSAVAACRPHRPSSTASPFARATMTSPAARAWYLPWWVSSTRRLTSPAA